MKRIILPLFFSFFIASMYSQVGIGTTNPASSSILDIKSDDKGLLIPRIKLENTSLKNPIDNPVEGLLVYNINSINDVTPGFYYWKENGPVNGGGEGMGSWKPLTTTGSNNGNGWILNGNNVGDADVLGTTNEKPLRFVVNGANFGKFETNGSISLGNNNSSTASGSNSTAIGSGATATGQNSTAIGFGASATQANTIRLGNDNARVGIGTSPNTSAALEINSNNKGILIPRVNLTSTTNKGPITGAPAESLLVYNNNIAGDVTKGFYYWTGSAWKSLEIAPGGGSVGGWTLNGNSVNAANFLGTTNYFPLNFKVNGTQFGSFAPNGGLALGIGAVANPNHSIAIGTSATASTGNQSVAIGPSANASGFQSQALGFQSLANNNSGLALGNNTIASGQNSTALGSGSKASGQNSTAIGFEAISTQPNTVKLGNDDALIDVSGQVKIGKKGSLHKNIMSFEHGMNLGNIPANASVIITIPIPSDLQPTNTKASILVTPSSTLNDDLHIAWVKMDGTTKIKVKLTNTSGTIMYNPYTIFYNTIHEF